MATTKPATKNIETLYLDGRQSKSARVIWEFKGLRFKSEIKVDSYDFQSHATCSVWSKEKMEWNLVYSIPYQQMRSCKSVQLYGTPDVKAEQQRDAFLTDILKLQEQTYKIIF